MKTEYLKNLIIFKEHSKDAYQSYLTRIQSHFQKLQLDPSVIKLAKFQTELHCIKDHKELKPKDKQPLFKYFVQRNISDFHLLRDSTSIELRLMKMTKTQLEDYQLNWKDIWERLLQKQPELPSVKSYNELTDFLRIIRHLYSPDNAVEVIQYFVERHSLYTDNLSNYITLFININQKTSKEVFHRYLQKLFQLYNLNQLKASDLLVMYLNAARYKQAQILPSVHEELSRIVLYSLSTPSSEKKDSIQSKFSTQTANIAFRIIGKCNNTSLELLQKIFQMLKLFIRPFQDSKKPLKFLCLFIMGFSKRLETEQGYRERIEKLKIKEEKRLNKINKEETQKQKLEEKKVQKKQSPKKEKPLVKQSQKQTQRDDEDESDEQQSSESESDDEDNDNKVDKLIKLAQLQGDDKDPEKASTFQTKIEKLELLLKNQVTEEIKAFVKEFVLKHIEQIFYVNSKKMVSRILKECFKMYPQTIPKSLQILEKAGNIPTINEDGLISNIKFIAKHLFAPQLRKDGIFLENVLKILARVKQSRRITDVWDILSAFILKLPLLDEKDMEKIPDSQKQDFQKKFNQNHDRFYQAYSEQIFQCVKRLFSESQYYDSGKSHSADKHILDLIGNSYPEFKKRVLRQMEENILENNNKFLLSIYHPGLRPSKTFEISLRDMIEHGSIESEQNMALNISVNTILSLDMDIEAIKILIRKYSKKNNYKFLKQIMTSLTNYNISFDPLSSSLNYLQNKPQIILKQQPSAKLIEDKILHVYNYAMELIDELNNQLKQFEEKPLKKMSYRQIVKQIYNSKENDFKNMKVEKRKNISELLQILKIILEHLFHQFQEYNPKTSEIQFRQSPYKRQSLLDNQKFINILNSLLYNEIFLHDNNIMVSLTSLVQNEIHFMYKHYINVEKNMVKRYTKKNQRQELPGQSNLLYTTNVQIGKTRVAHFSLLYNKYKEVVDIQPIKEQMEMLLIAPGNQRSNYINKIIVKKSVEISIQAQRLIYFLSNSFGSRFYYEKIFNLFADFLTSGYKFKPNQIVDVINYHLPLIQSQNIKIKDYALKSLQKFFKVLRKKDVFGTVEHQLRQFAKRDKLELIWIIAIIIIGKEGRRDTPVEEYLSQTYAYLDILEYLIQSDIRIVRRMALFAYSFCYRRARQAVKISSRVSCSQIKYSKFKTIEELYETGFLREQHINSQQIAGKQMLTKLAPYSTYRKKEYIQSQMLQKIQQNAFNFILNNPDLGLKLLKQFHVDTAASVEQLISMMQNKKHDLSEIAVRNLQGCYVYAKLQKLHFDRFEHHFGQAFYRYLLSKDARTNKMRFFIATKDEVEKMLTNLEGFDNQTCLFIYLGDLLSAYEYHSKDLEEQMRGEVQKFVLKIMTEMIYKGSGSIFKQLMSLISKRKQKKSLTFIATFLQGLIANRQKVSRACQLIFTLCEDNNKLYQKLSKEILTNKLEINNSYINTLLNTVITLPEKIMLTEEQIKKYGIIDLQKELQQKNLQKLYNFNIYLPSNAELNDFLVETIKNFVESIDRPTQNEEEVKIKNELIKATYSITTNLITTFSQFYQTPESVSTILKLLDLLFKLFGCKMDMPLDYKQLEQTLKTVLSNKHDFIANFEECLDSIVRHVSNLPVKKQADVVKIIANRPGNFHFVSQEYYQQFITKVLGLESHSMIYKDLLISLSTLLSYVPLPFAKIQKLIANSSKNQGLLLMQAYVMSTEDIRSEFIDSILEKSNKERRNMFCKEMLHLRGKKEYLDDEERYISWKKIKQYSNPYHYHA